MDKSGDSPTSDLFSPVCLSVLSLPQGSRGDGELSAQGSMKGISSPGALCARQHPCWWMEEGASGGVLAMTLLLGKTRGPCVIRESGQEPPPPSKRTNQHAFLGVTEGLWGSEGGRLGCRQGQRPSASATPTIPWLCNLG